MANLFSVPFVIHLILKMRRCFAFNFLFLNRKTHGPQTEPNRWRYGYLNYIKRKNRPTKNGPTFNFVRSVANKSQQRQICQNVCWEFILVQMCTTWLKAFTNLELDSIASTLRGPVLCILCWMDRFKCLPNAGASRRPKCWFTIPFG